MGCIIQIQWKGSMIKRQFFWKVSNLRGLPYLIPIFWWMQTCFLVYPEWCFGLVYKPLPLWKILSGPKFSKQPVALQFAYRKHSFAVLLVLLKSTNVRVFLKVFSIPWKKQRTHTHTILCQPSTGFESMFSNISYRFSFWCVNCPSISTLGEAAVKMHPFPLWRCKSLVL